MKDFEAIGAGVGRLVARKQLAYGDSFGRSGDVLRQLYPQGIQPPQYDDLLTIARILDKLFRIATEKDAYDENPYQDIVGYGLLGMGRHQDGSPTDTKPEEESNDEPSNQEEPGSEEGLGNPESERYETDVLPREDN